jgi:hypothetical protein
MDLCVSLRIPIKKGPTVYQYVISFIPLSRTTQRDIRHIDLVNMNADLLSQFLWGIHHIKQTLQPVPLYPVQPTFVDYLSHVLPFAAIALYASDASMAA